MTDTPQRRAFTRVHVTLDATVDGAPTKLISSRTKDISVGGIYVFSSAPLGLGTLCTVTLQLAGAPAGASVTLPGRVARIDGEGMGIAFTPEPDRETLQRLGEMVEGHAGASEVAREFFAQIALRHEPPEP